jgi:serine/threonine-protein kinase RsbW
MIDCVAVSYRSSFALRNDASELSSMTEWIVGACKAAGISDKTSFALQLCLEEAVANIMEHSRGEARAREIIASIVREASDIVLTVEDDGAQFDSTQVAAPRREHTLADAPVGGLCIPLMRKFASSIEYRRKDGGNQLRLTFAVA